VRARLDVRVDANVDREVPGGGSMRGCARGRLFDLRTPRHFNTAGPCCRLHKARDPLDAGFAQLEEYLARLWIDRGWLARFGQRASAPALPDRVHIEEVVTAQGRAVTVLRL
jgi:hypothetical protein